MGRTKTFERNDVLDKAIQLFWLKGFAETSLQDLEKATGVNKSGLYSEFKDKEDLFVESLKRYRDTHLALEVLKKKPMGWSNIQNYLKIGIKCSGQKGCYFANTLRETSIVPSKAKNIMFAYTNEIRDLISENLRNTSTKKDVLVLTGLIMTIGTGLSLKLNAMSPAEVEKEVDSFVELLKAN